MPLDVTQAAPHVVLIRIDNQPKRNAMSRTMMAELAAIWERLGASDDCRCIIITGTGERAFCAGADIGDDLSASEQTARMVDRALLKTKPYSKPIIAAVNGDCAGGGVELLLSTDIRLAAEHADLGTGAHRRPIWRRRLGLGPGDWFGHLDPARGGAAR